MEEDNEVIQVDFEGSVSSVGFSTAILDALHLVSTIYAHSMDVKNRSLRVHFLA